MNALLTVASRVEAAMVSYNSLARPIANKETWRHCFREERANAGHHFCVLPNSPKRSHISWHLVGNSGEKLLSHAAAEAQSVAPQRPLPRIRLLPLTQLPAPLVGVENVSMDMDELAGDDYVLPSQLLHASRIGKATEKGSTSQKQKGTLLLRAAATRHHASSLWQESTSEEEADEDIPLLQYKFEVHD
ncbi:hypothetical protein EI94DRAFT_1708192 [Lactarius quietus]|nr:hypothetical protein EI94DRAFT_1708192 [Lactarius quietus]